jgi:hypothetical protein
LVNRFERPNYPRPAGNQQDESINRASPGGISWPSQRLGAGRFGQKKTIHRSRSPSGWSDPTAVDRMRQTAAEVSGFRPQGNRDADLESARDDGWSNVRLCAVDRLAAARFDNRSSRRRDRRANRHGRAVRPAEAAQIAAIAARGSSRNGRYSRQNQQLLHGDLSAIRIGGETVGAKGRLHSQRSQQLLPRRRCEIVRPFAKSGGGLSNSTLCFALCKRNVRFF